MWKGERPGTTGIAGGRWTRSDRVAEGAEPAAKKRANNHGTIYRRADGRWCAQIWLGYEGGKPKRKTVYGKTQDDVWQQSVAIQRDKQQGLPVVTKGQTVAKFLEGWLDDAVKPSVREQTYKTYESTARLHIVPVIGRIALDKLTPQDVQRMMGVAAAKGFTATHVGYCRVVLRIALNKALKWGLVARNVAALADPPRSEPYEAQYLSIEETHRFLNAVKGDRLEALYVVATTLGLRKGELCGLRWQDIDLEAATLSVRHQLQRVGGRKQLVEPKTRSSRRTVALPPFVVAILRAHKARQRAERQWAAGKWREGGFVFTTRIGTPLEASNLSRSFHALLDATEIPRQRFHNLRHSAATLMLAQGVDATTIMAVLGHAHIGTTINLYAHVMPQVKRDAADRMEALFAMGA